MSDKPKAPSASPSGEDLPERESPLPTPQEAEALPEEQPSSTSDDQSDKPPGEETTSELSAEKEAPEEETVETLRENLSRLRDQLLRTAADFDNFRKRSRREVADADRRAREELLRDLLPVFDNLERAAAHAESATDTKGVVDGIQLVLGQFKDTATRLGIERVPAVGQAFDPAVHEAIQHMETTEHPPGSIAAEVLAGYKMGDRLIRPSMVVVAKRPPTPAEPEQQTNGEASGVEQGSEDS